MTQRKRKHGRRSAFTLIELLVVIAIIAILMALLGAAVMRTLVKGPEITAKAEIREFDQRLTGLMNASTGAVPSVPSRLHLSKKNRYVTSNALDVDTIAYLQARFGGRHACFDFQNPPANNQFIDWNGDGATDEELILEGEQCLVFHLGGIPQLGNGGTVGMTGFSNNIQNPAQVGGTRQQTSFEFQPARLVLMSCATHTLVAPPYTAANIVGTFPVYKDPFSLTNKPYPYAFFAPVGGVYNKYAAAFGGSDCLSLPGSPSPYIQASSPITTFVYPNGFQILSSGRDGIFGAGGANWNPVAGTSDPNGKDDYSNFSKGVLGGPPN